MAKNDQKAKYWWAVLYPENMIEDWEQKVADIVQLPFAYAVHDQDTDSQSGERKKHVHLMIVFPNTTTYSHATTVFSLLNAEGKKAFNKIQAMVNIRHCYDYLLHQTESCKKEEKFEYPESSRITGNNFDIGCFEQIGLAEKRKMLKDLMDYALEFKIQNMSDFYKLLLQNFPDEYFDVYIAYNRNLETLTRGNFLKYGEKKKQKK